MRFASGFAQLGYSDATSMSEADLATSSVAGLFRRHLRDCWRSVSSGLGGGLPMVSVIVSVICRMCRLIP